MVRKPVNVLQSEISRAVVALTLKALTPVSLVESELVPRVKRAFLFFVGYIQKTNIIHNALHIR